MYCGNCGIDKEDGYCDECKKKTIVTLSGFSIPQIPMSFDNTVDNYNMMMFRSGHIMHYLTLDTDTPFGNLTLIFSNLLQDIEYLNDKIRDVYKLYAQGMYFDLDNKISTTSHVRACEDVVYWMRRIIDRLIMIHWIVYKNNIDNKYPKKIEIELIGKLLEIGNQKKSNEKSVFFQQYKEKDIIFLNFINETSNAFKHSIFNDEGTSLRIGQYEPLVISLNLKHNDSDNSQIYCHESLTNVVYNFISFYKNIRECINDIKSID